MLIITILTCLAFGATIAVGGWLHFRGFEHDESNVVLCSQVGTDGIPSQVALGVPCPSQADASGASRPKRQLNHRASAQPAHESLFRLGQIQQTRRWFLIAAQKAPIAHTERKLR